MRYRFKVGQLVIVDGLKCQVLEREKSRDSVLGDSNDYLCRPVDRTKMVLGQTELGAGWVYETNIKAVK